MSEIEVVSYADPETLARTSAARLAIALGDVQATRGSASVALTGGGIGIDVLRELRDSPARDAIDFTRLDVYWGDERFVPAGDAERNEAQARAALLDHVPVDPDRVFAIPASDGVHGDSPEAAADAYARTLAAHSPDGAPSPAFDVTLLGLGPEGHTASLFPGTRYAREREQSVLAVHESPKPPPTRVSLSLPAIRRSREVWVIAAGEAKADALGLAFAGADAVDLPIAGARGATRTRWLLDTPAAARARIRPEPEDRR